MPRDEFTKTVIEVLAKRVRNRCSRCKAPTSGPHSSESKAVVVGVAAHITAASEGGPRYDPLLGPDERSGASNGIWLCQTCAKLIDSDVARYPLEVVRHLKSQAEEEALAEIEGRLPAEGKPQVISVQFAVDSWQLWRERGNLPSDAFVIVSIWGRGDLRYACNIRLRNNSLHEEQLFKVRMQFRAAAALVHEDFYAIQYEIVLPPQKWVTIPVEYGLHKNDEPIVTSADSIWFAADVVGTTQTLAWKVSDFDHRAVAAPSF